MANNPETGHDKNVANLERIITSCMQFGTKYNPANASIQLSALQQLLTKATQACEAVSTANAHYKNMTNQREERFDTVKELCTRIVRMLKASGVSKETLTDARSILNSLRGKRKTKPGKKGEQLLPEGGESETTEQISVSHQSYDKQVSYFFDLISLISNQPLYQPNEPELSVQQLGILHLGLKSATSMVNQAYTAIVTARAERNKILYDDLNGLVPVGQNVKAYVKAAFGTKSAEYKQISGIRLRFAR